MTTLQTLCKQERSACLGVAISSLMRALKALELKARGCQVVLALGWCFLAEPCAQNYAVPHTPDPVLHCRYDFTTFAIDLNHLTPEMQAKLPPTDSRRRQDVRLIEQGDYDKVCQCARVMMMQAIYKISCQQTNSELARDADDKCSRSYPQSEHAKRKCFCWCRQMWRRSGSISGT